MTLLDASEVSNKILAVDEALKRLTLQVDGSHLTVFEAYAIGRLTFNAINRQSERIELEYIDNGIKLSVVNGSDEVSALLPLPTIDWYPLVYVNHPAFPSVLRLLYGNADNVALAINDIKALNVDVTIEEFGVDRIVNFAVGTQSMSCQMHEGLYCTTIRLTDVHGNVLAPHNNDPSLVFEKIINDLFRNRES